jgi:hypothetical protein
MPFGVPWSNSPPGYFSTRPAVVSGLSKAVSWSRFGLEPTAIWGLSVEELFHDARHPHSQNRQTRSSCQDRGIDGSAGVKPGVL